jgi:hypothetical protein
MEAAPIPAAMVIARAPVDTATPAVPAPAIIAAAVVAAAVIAAAIVRRAIIAAGIERRDITDGGIDAGVLASGECDRERRNDRAQKNPTTNHVSLLGVPDNPRAYFPQPGDRQTVGGRTLLKPC